MAFPAPAWIETFFAGLAELMAQMPPGPPEMGKLGEFYGKGRPAGRLSAAEVKLGIFTVPDATNPDTTVETILAADRCGA